MFENSTMKSYVLTILIVTIFCITIIQCDPEPMARPTRPKVITSQEQLMKYLDDIADYYSIQGKSRYGKRAGRIPSSSVYLGYPWDTLKFILDTHRRLQQQKEEKGNTIKGHIFRDFQVFRNSPPNNFNDVIDKYYDDIE